MYSDKFIILVDTTEQDDILISNWKSHSFQKNCFYLIQWKLLKNDENPFYFMLKTLSVLDIFTFLSQLFD